MEDLFRANFFWIDFIIGISAGTAIALLYLKGKISRFNWHLFLIGAGLGFIWEFLCNINIAFSSCPVAR